MGSVRQRKNVVFEKRNVTFWGEFHFSAVGWGRVFESADRGSTTLQQVLLQVEEGSQCDRIKSGRDINSQFCAGDLSTSLGRDTCQGDR